MPGHANLSLVCRFFFTAYSLLPVDTNRVRHFVKRGTVVRYSKIPGVVLSRLFF
jgi:hypothetical protein